MGCLLPAYRPRSRPRAGQASERTIQWLIATKWNVGIISKSMKIKTPIFHHSNILIFLRDEATNKEF
jgi:hypothetical protein